MTLANLIGKMHAASRSARLLFDAKDFDGSANRAYYAMFDAARAYLVVHHGVATEQIKTHSGLISAFGQLGVKQDGLAADLGRWLNQANEVRSSADYGSRSVDEATARRLIGQMDRFIADLSTSIGMTEGG
jgi:uncharacterized protein (UPF0332 family)